MDKSEIKAVDKDIKEAQKSEKLAKKIAKEEETMCRFTCLGETDWGKSTKSCTRKSFLQILQRTENDFVARRQCRVA